MKNQKQQKISVGMLSLGCPKTLVDSELVLGHLNHEHFQMAEHISNCDIAFLNTCAFIEDAKQESINRILELIELKREGKVGAIVVLGCLFQRYPKELSTELKEVDAFLGTGEYAKVPEIAERLRSNVLHEPSQRQIEQKEKYFEPFTAIGKPGFMYTSQNHRIALTPAHFRYLKVSEGCDHTCSFCTIPSFRGKHRSRLIADIVREAEDLAKAGCKEIVLTGQDTTHYGKDYSNQFLLPELLQSLSSISGIEWVRILYAYPSFVTDSLIQAIGKVPKVCHYLDMPLQHISDPILIAMRRGVTKKRTIDLVERLRGVIPDLALRTTFIVGFPGETDLQFRELLEFMEQFQFERVGIFTYSQEEGTSAGQMANQIPEKIKRQRFAQAMELQQEISKSNNQKWIQKTLEVVIDEASEDNLSLYHARSYMDAPEVDGMVLVKVRDSSKKLSPGEFIKVRITGAQEYDLTAELIE
ncbi:MAG: 30S ribosomal protein S12 methylthiotransferase RimO [Candidatus Omnitrophica bacterium]|nr:30S ribosomal protein S12 methylthiotransferase RimO [Candidatus Omnitrophota bacterium]